jgi:hypothetical protein
MADDAASTKRVLFLLNGAIGSPSRRVRTGQFERLARPHRTKKAMAIAPTMTW